MGASSECTAFVVLGDASGKRSDEHAGRTSWRRQVQSEVHFGDGTSDPRLEVPAAAELAIHRRAVPLLSWPRKSSLQPPAHHPRRRRRLTLTAAPPATLQRSPATAPAQEADNEAGVHSVLLPRCCYRRAPSLDRSWQNSSAAPRHMQGPVLAPQRVRVLYRRSLEQHLIL